MRCLVIMVLLSLSVNIAQAQYSAVRVNTLALATGTVNVGVDVALSDKWSVDVSAYWNPISTKSFRSKTAALFLGVRRWRFEPHVGAFWGTHTTYAKYDFGGANHHFKGCLTGIGLSYGYSWLLSTRWNFSLEGGVACIYMNDSRQNYSTAPTDDIYIYHYRRVVVAPSKLEASFSYLF